MPTTIDHTAHPHIIDTILKHSTPKVLLAFSSTAKTYRAKLASWLSHSSIHRAGATSRGHVLKSKSGDAPPVLPFLPGFVEVLDVVDECACRDSTLYAPDHAGNSAFTNLVAVRRLRSGGCTSHKCDIAPPSPARAPSATVVDYLDLDVFGARGIDADLSVAVHPITSRNILHLRWCEDQPIGEASLRGLSRCRLHAHGGTDPRELVIVLHPYVTTGARIRAKSMLALLGNMMWVLSSSGLGARGSTLRITVVGAETADLGRSHIPPTTGGYDFGNFLLKLKKHLLARMYFSNIVTEVLNVTTFLAVDEWRSSLGDLKTTLGQWPEEEEV